MIKNYSIKKIGYHPDRMKILRRGTAYLRKYLDKGYTKAEAIKQANIDAAFIGSNKKGIKALPVNFKGKFMNFSFAIINQFDIYNQVEAEFYDTTTSNHNLIFTLRGNPDDINSAKNIMMQKIILHMDKKNYADTDSYQNYGNEVKKTFKKYTQDEALNKTEKKVIQFLKQVNNEVQKYNSKKMIPAAKKFVKQHEPEVKKSIPQMAHRKKTARKKTAKRKTVHTIPGKVKSYRRKATVKAHTRLVAGIGNINSVSLNYDELKRILQTQLLNREKLQKSVKSKYFSKEHNAVTRRLIKEYGLWIAHTKQKMNEEKKLLKKLIQ